MERRLSDCEQQTHRQTLTLRGDRTYTHTHTLTFSIYEAHQVDTLHSENSRQMDHFSTGNCWRDSYRQNWARQLLRDGELLLSKTSAVPLKFCPKVWILSLTRAHTQWENRRRCEKSQLPLHFSFQCLSFYFYLFLLLNLYLSYYIIVLVLDFDWLSELLYSSTALTFQHSRQVSLYIRNIHINIIFQWLFLQITSLCIAFKTHWIIYSNYWFIQERKKWLMSESLNNSFNRYYLNSPWNRNWQFLFV